MWKAVAFIACLALLVTFVNMMAEHRAGNELVMRLCADQQNVIFDLRTLLIEQKTGDPVAIKETRSSMIAAKLLFIMPQQSGEADASYLARLRQYLEERCVS